MGETRRLILLGLDGYEPSLGEALMARGALPALARLKARSACFALEHGSARRTGLAWEHVSTGLSPEDAGRFAAVDFDAARYVAWQRPTNLLPFTAGFGRCRTLVFDPPYFDLARSPSAQGLVAWGAHDPGVAPAARPAGLAEEIAARFGPYPATPWIYGFVWPSAERTRIMGAALVEAVERRAAIARWLLAERLPDWDLAYLVVSELHSGVEALWHGLDPGHPLHGHPSAAPAGAALEALHRALDRLVATLVEAFPDAMLVAVTPHGMGPNHGDVASMLLLPELLYRHSFGRPLLPATAVAGLPGEALPLLAEEERWDAPLKRGLKEAMRPRGLARLLRHLRPAAPPPAGPGQPSGQLSLAWMPAAWYAPFWPRMRAFAVPSFYDGRLRINLRGREGQGRVPPRRYEALCEELVLLLAACRDPCDGGPVVATVERAPGDPLRRGPSEADLTFVWRRGSLALSHPALGQIGPVACRRTGGHTGGHGLAWFANTPLPPGERGLASAFDVVPSVLALLGESRPGLSGRSLLAQPAPSAA